MSFFVWCEIVCVKCASTICGRHTSKSIPRREMKTEAKSFGWTFTPDGEALCKKCSNGHMNSTRPNLLL